MKSSVEIWMTEEPDHWQENLREQIRSRGVRKLFWIHGHSMDHLALGRALRAFLAREGIETVFFTGVRPNPDIGIVREALLRYQNSGCDGILAVGGGSVIDVAKCVKRFAACDAASDLLTGDPEENAIPLIAAPTTAGTGSEATHFAVVYQDGRKYSVAHPSLVPDVVLFDPEALVMLSSYQKQATALDAFCHAVESCWSVHATLESQRFSVQSLQLLCPHIEAYLQSNPSVETCREMMRAANLAGKAINLAKTTAGHAMCYGLTKRYGIAHGHAAALCVAKLWPELIQCAKQDEGLSSVLQHIAEAMGTKEWMEGPRQLAEWLRAWGLVRPLEQGDAGQAAEELADQVNLQRLGNYPQKLTKEHITALYQRVLRGE